MLKKVFVKIGFGQSAPNMPRDRPKLMYILKKYINYLFFLKKIIKDKKTVKKS